MDMDEVQTELNGTSVSANNADGVVGSGINQLRGWNPSSRIIRVSRASGGKDRHSKVWTSKGLRDRRVRLSVSTAIQFYDLQDRLGYDQPSKAVEWLIKAAADSISELPSINTAFPDTPSNNNLQVSDEKMGSNGNENQQMDLEIGQNSQSQALSLSKSACSSTSDTSKNSSGLSLSRSEIRGSNRAKARERAKERAVKEKENAVQQNPSSSSFTQLLTGNFADGNSPAAGYLSHHQGYNGQFQLGNSNFPHHHHQTMSIVPPFSITGANQNQNQNHHQEALHQFSFVPESLFHPAGSAGEYGTLNFSISGYNRGTLQSNSPSLFSNTVQGIPSSSTNMDGSNIPFFIGSSAGPAFENHHHQHHQFMTRPDGSLQLYYGDGSSNHKDKGKN